MALELDVAEERLDVRLEGAVEPAGALAVAAARVSARAFRRLWLSKPSASLPIVADAASWRTPLLPRPQPATLTPMFIMFW